MNWSRVLVDRQFRRVAIAVGVVTIVLLVVNIFKIGGDVFVHAFNNSIDFPLAIFVALSILSHWRFLRLEKRKRGLWLGLLIGWCLWALAEVIWAVDSIRGQEVPYPSAADIFWLIGYIPMGVGLIARLRAISIKPTRTQNIFIYLFTAATLLITGIYVFIPIVQGFDPGLLVESILNLAYPLADLLLMMIVWRLFFTYEQGYNGFVWRIISIGFLFMTFADLVFSYATWQEIYYPDMTATLISLWGVDVPYTLSYLLWIIGLSALRVLVREDIPILPADKIRMVRTYGHMLVYTGADNEVIDVSPNFHLFFGEVEVTGKPLAEALQITAQEADTFLKQLHTDGRLADLPLKLRDASGDMRDVRLCGLLVTNTAGEVSGCNLLLRTRVRDTSFDEELSSETRYLARYIMDKSGSRYQSEIGHFITDYYIVHMKSLFGLVSSQGGETMSQALLARLQQTAREHNWQLHFNLQTVLDADTYPLEVLREALPILLEEAMQFVSDAMDPVVVENHMRELSLQLGGTIQHDIEFYGKAGSVLGFSDHRRERREEV